ncbi:thioredoxin domain-containing protein [Candidatus Pacearchaeota archaeon]|nr:thioredoxin domain-containing protein [Candidatus Pacearchaeota archaeon]
MEKDKSEKRDVVEIPIGKIFNVAAVRKNPWILSSVVIAVVLVLVLVFGRGGTGGISASVAGESLVNFINSQGQGSASLVSSDREGQLYKVVVNYNGDEVPVFVTLDGKYLIVDPVPLSGTAVEGTGDAAGTDTPTNTGERVTVETGDSPVLGDVNAQVTIVEFSDYECPYCGRHFSETYPQLVKNYIDTGKAKLIFMDYPLSFHPNAQKAAEAARCFGAQKGDSGYFKMHDKLYQNQQALSIENYKKWARELGANGAKFDACLDSNEFADEVQANLAYGSSLGVSGTPGFFINGVRVEGAQPYSVFKQIIDSELNA